MCSTQTLCARCTHKHTHTKYTAHTLCVLGASRYSRTILMQSICTRYTNTYTDVSARSLLLHTHIHTYTHIRTPTHIRTHTHTHSHTCNYTHAYAGVCVLHHCSRFLPRHTDTQTHRHTHVTIHTRTQASVCYTIARFFCTDTQTHTHATIHTRTQACVCYTIARYAGWLGTNITAASPRDPSARVSDADRAAATASAALLPQLMQLAVTALYVPEASGAVCTYEFVWL
jgi:hypothetical protein